MNRNETVTKAAVVRRGINQIAKLGFSSASFRPRSWPTQSETAKTATSLPWP